MLGTGEILVKIDIKLRDNDTYRTNEIIIVMSVTEGKEW